ncbi:MAG: FG-GAP-like repeat-containing protein [candidate division Zixibacteria bacterium]
MKYSLILPAILIIFASASVFAADAFFYERNSLPTQIKPASITCSDLNNDGHQDIIVGNYSSTSVTVLLGSGDGNFYDITHYPAGGKVWSLCAADMNGDGFSDIISANLQPFNFSILFNQGDGVFGEPSIYETEQGNLVVKGEYLDNDGDIDLVITTLRGRGQIFMNNGDSTFTQTGDLGVGLRAYGLDLSDYDNDNDIDIGVVNYVSMNIPGRFIHYLNKGDGSYYYPVLEYRCDPGSKSACSGDFNSDGNIDIAVANDESDNIFIIPGNGDGTFGEYASYFSGYSPRSIVSGDVDNDGDDDLIVANFMKNHNGRITVLYNDEGDFSENISFYAMGSTQAVCAADFNEDDKIDIAATISYSNSVSIYLNQSFMCGDANDDKKVNIGDPVYLISYIFRGGPEPFNWEAGNVNCDDETNIGDAIFLINHVFKNGTWPCAGCN